MDIQVYSGFEIVKSIPHKVFCKKAILNIFGTFTENTHSEVLF